MPTLPELRAHLVRQQAAVLACDAQLNATAPGTAAYGELRSRQQQLGLAVNTTKKRIATAQQGSQPTLL